MLYVAVSLVVTGMVKYTEIKVDAPLAEAFRSVGHPGFATVISVGALIGLTTVMMILMLGQSRVFFAMSRDRLLPPVFAKVSPRFGTPVRTTILTGVVVALISTFVPLTELAELVNIGTLFAFVARRHRRARAAPHPSGPRAGVPLPGRAGGPDPGGPAAVYLMLNLPGATWIRFVVWMVDRPRRLLRLRARRRASERGRQYPADHPRTAATSATYGVSLTDPRQRAAPRSRWSAATGRGGLA